MSAPVWSGLTEKQECFAHLVADGLNFSAAYRQVYDCSEMSSSSIWREAHRLSRNEKVAERVAELVTQRRQQADIKAQTRASRVISQLEGIMDGGTSEMARLRAAELLGKTVGMFREVRDTSGGDTIADLEAKLDRLLRSPREPG